VTLDTSVYVQGPVNPLAVFIKCNQLLGAHEGVKCSDELDTIYSSDAKSWLPGPPNGRRTLMNEPSQGLSAWLMLHYRAEGPLQKAGEHSKYCDGPDECSQPDGCATPCWVEVSFDTTYSYRGPEGGCGDLHARLVAELGRWLDELGADWSWMNEFTGEIHHRYDGLEKLGAGGLKALTWMASTVMPAIGNMIEPRNQGKSCS
jgi:hypothetical protein